MYAFLMLAAPAVSWVAALIIGLFIMPLAMALRLSTAARNAAADGIVDLLDAGAGAGTIKIYTGSQPTNVSDTPAGTLLGTLTFSDPAFGAASSGVATASAITSDTTADASGTAGCALMEDSNGNNIFDCTCGQGSGDISFDNNVIVAGGTIAISSMTVTQPI